MRQNPGRIDKQKPAPSQPMDQDDNGKKHFTNRQAITPEDGGKGQAIPLREVPQTKSEADQGAGSVVLPDVPGRGGGVGR